MIPKLAHLTLEIFSLIVYKNILMNSKNQLMMSMNHYKNYMDIIDSLLKTNLDGNLIMRKEIRMVWNIWRICKELIWISLEGNVYHQIILHMCMCLLIIKIVKNHIINTSILWLLKRKQILFHLKKIVQLMKNGLL